jgi:hypothetical protein
MYRIIGRGRASRQMMFNYIKQCNTKRNSLRSKYIIEHYKWEAVIEKINSNIAFAQMSHEKNFLKFGGVIDSNQNNFIGLGTMSYGAYWAYFSNKRWDSCSHSTSQSPWFQKT